MLTLEYEPRAGRVGVCIGSRLAGLPDFYRSFSDMDAAQSFVCMAMTALARRRASLLALDRARFTAAELRETIAELANLSKLMGGREAPAQEATQ